MLPNRDATIERFVKYGALEGARSGRVVKKPFVCKMYMEAWVGIAKLFKHYLSQILLIYFTHNSRARIAPLATDCRPTCPPYP